LSAIESARMADGSGLTGRPDISPYQRGDPRKKRRRASSPKEPDRDSRRRLINATLARRASHERQRHSCASTCRRDNHRERASRSRIDIDRRLTDRSIGALRFSRARIGPPEFLPDLVENWNTARRWDPQWVRLQCFRCGGEGGIRTRQDPLDSVSCRF
jgi:hypothetical protein